MMVKKIKLLLILLLSWGCHSPEKKGDSHVEYAHEIIRDFSAQMEKEFGIVCIGSGGGMPNKIEEIQVAFAAYRQASIDEARELEIKGTEKLLSLINAHEEARPYLQEYPFKHERAYVSISFRQKDETRFPDSVSLVFQANDQIYYCAQDPVKNLLINLKTEPYEEARDTVCQTNSSLAK